MLQTKPELGYHAICPLTFLATWDGPHELQYWPCWPSSIGALAKYGVGGLVVRHRTLVAYEKGESPEVNALFSSI